MREDLEEKNQEISKEFKIRFFLHHHLELRVEFVLQCLFLQSSPIFFCVALSESAERVPPT